MATRASLRLLLRRFLKEDEADNWTDVELNELLNFGLQDLQEYVMDVAPEAFMKWATIDIVADQRYYPMPTDIHSEIEFGYSSDPTVNAYLPLDIKDFAEIRQYESSVSRGTDVAIADQGSTQTNDYAQVGRYWYLGWTPDVAVTAGLQSTYKPVLTMAADSDVPDIHVNLHKGIAYAAALIAMDESDQSAERFETRLSQIVGRIPRYYSKSSSRASVIRIEGIGSKDY